MVKNFLKLVLVLFTVKHNIHKKLSSQLRSMNTVDTVKLMPLLHQAISDFFQVSSSSALSFRLFCTNIVVGSVTICSFLHGRWIKVHRCGLLGAPKTTGEA